MSTPAPQAEARYIFEPIRRKAVPEWYVNERWIDLYALLGVPVNAAPEVVEDAIISRGADCVLFAFARGGGKPELIEAIEAHISEFRPVLLDPDARRRYNRQLRLHRAGDADGLDYAVFLESVTCPEAAGCLGPTTVALALLFCVMRLVVCGVGALRVLG